MTRRTRQDGRSVQREKKQRILLFLRMPSIQNSLRIIRHARLFTVLHFYDRIPFSRFARWGLGVSLWWEGERACLHISCRSSKMTDQLGFHNLPFLAHRKSVKRGFEFTLMVVGKFLSPLHAYCMVSALRFASSSSQASLVSGSPR